MLVSLWLFVVFPAAPSSGKISAAAIWWHIDSKRQPLPMPMVAMEGFKGLCTIVGSNLDDRNNAYIQLKGDGAKAALFCAGTFFTAGGNSPKMEDAWVDQTAPAAEAVMFAGNGASMTKVIPAPRSDGGCRDMSARR